MAGWCHDVLHICSGTWLLLTEMLTQDQSRCLPKDQLPQRVLVRVLTEVSVPSEETFSCSCAATLLLGRGQKLRTYGARHRASARFDAPFCRCIWLHQVPQGGRRDCARVVVGDARARLASRRDNTHKHD